MSRRIDVELTSDRGDGTWSWRAAGAKQPKGVVDGALLYDGAQVGDVVRAEADFDIDGITVTAVQPPKHAKPAAERIEVRGVEREFSPVTSSLTGKARERAERGEDDRPRRGRDDRGPRPGGARPGGPGRPERGDRGPRPGGADRPQRGDRPSRPARPAPPPPRPKAKKLRPGRTHRDALLASLSPEQQPVAEQLLRGGMPAVRQAVEEQNAKAKAEEGLEVPVDTVLGIAEGLVARTRVADWLDRAEAARDAGDELALRDLRSVVSSADDVARDETTRELAAELRAVLDRRTESEQQTWVSDMESSLAGGRVVRALRLSSRPPEPGSGVPEELTARLTEAAGGALSADIAPDRWATVLDAVAYSPVRRAVVPAGAPPEPTEELLAAVRKHAGRTPAIAALFGVEPPPDKAKGGRRPDRAAGRNPNLARPSGPRAGAVPVPGRPGGPPVPPARRIPPPPGRKIGATLPGTPPSVPQAAPADADTAPAEAEVLLDAAPTLLDGPGPEASADLAAAAGGLAPAAAEASDGAPTEASSPADPDAVPTADQPVATEPPATAQGADEPVPTGPLTAPAVEAEPAPTGDPAPEATPAAPTDPLAAPAVEADPAPALPDAAADEPGVAATGPADSSLPEPPATADAPPADALPADAGATTGAPSAEVDAVVAQGAAGPFEPPADPPVDDAANSPVGSVGGDHEGSSEDDRG